MVPFSRHYTSSVSVVIVLLVPELEIVVRDADVLPLKMAASNNITTTAPTIHTHGAVYHSLVVVVVVVFTVRVESCATEICPVRQDINRTVSSF